MQFRKAFPILIPLCSIFFACAPLPPLGPSGSDIPKPPEPAKPSVELPESAQQDTEKRYVINVGIAFEKNGNATIECTEKKWEFKVGSNLGKTEIETQGPCKYKDKTYRGNWAVLSTDSGLAIINSLPVEDYLKGVVPHEIGRLKQDGFEALKAQAVAARTYAYSHLDSRKSQGFDVYADTRDQVYDGINGEDTLASEAILATNGLVLKHNGKLIEAYYHSTCGGKTASLEVWGQENKGFLIPISDSASGKPFCEASRYMRWEEKFTMQELVSLLQRNALDARVDKPFSFSKIEQILITEKFEGGRVKRLVVFTDKGSFEVFGDRTRRLFARDGKILPSSLFSISQSGDNFSITGSGFGHGIGMCQMGARARSSQGQKFDEILKAYYTDVVIEKW